MLDPNYTALYRLYRKLPTILALTIAGLMFIWSIVDVSAFTRHSYYYTYYGVMGLKSLFLVLIIWWAIGAVLCAATYFFSALTISPTIARTDAILEMNEKMNMAET